MENEKVEQAAAEQQILIRITELMCRENLITAAEQLQAENRIYRRYRS